MNHIKNIHIEGFKKFENLNIEFNEHVNILVGENEAGKSTILEAIRIVLNQQYKNADKTFLKDLFNLENIKAFKEKPSSQTLPKIIITIEFALDPKSKDAEYFSGENYGEHKPQDEKYGLTFECKFDESLGIELDSEIKSGKIPYEYYTLSWKTFGNKQYQAIKKPLKLLSIDISGKDSATSFNYYNKTLFSSRYDEPTKMDAKYRFRYNLEESFEAIKLNPISESRQFGIDSKKIPLESIISVYDNGIALENQGSGMECLIKTQIALDRKSGLDVILMEEPENHLCPSNLRKMLNEIVETQNTSQMIITTHNNMIASHLDLTNILWITKNQIQSLKDLNKDDADFFKKSDDNALLQLLLSKKAILVEGATESMLIPFFYSQTKKHSLDQDEITVISCGGISFHRYLSIAEKLEKKVAVLTDNDQSPKKIENSINYNNNHKLQHIFLGDNINDEWTWEACIYKDNKDSIEKLLTIDNDADYLFHGKKLNSPYLGKMLNNKANTAYKMLTSNQEFNIPKYVKDAFEWLTK